MYLVSTPVELSADDVDVVDQHPDAHPPKIKKIKESHPANGKNDQTSEFMLSGMSKLRPSSAQPATGKYPSTTAFPFCMRRCIGLSVTADADGVSSVD